MSKVLNNVERYVNGYASDLIKRADKDYITARMCYANELIDNFLWNGQQCIEKYLKAIALIHKINVKEEGHRLLQLFKRVNKKIKIGQQSIDIFPVAKMPDGSAIKYNKGTRKAGQEYGTFYDFLDRLTYLGMNRYSSYSYYTNDIGIMQLDAVVYIIRRYGWSFDAIVGKEGKPLGEKIKADIDKGSYYSIQGYLEKVEKQENTLKKYLLKDNFYYPKLIKHGNYPQCSLFVNHVLDRLYNDAENGSVEHKETYIGVANFLLDNLKFDCRTKKIIKDNIRAMYDKTIIQLKQ